MFYIVHKVNFPMRTYNVNCDFDTTFFPTHCKLRSRRRNTGCKVSAFSSCVLEQVRSTVHIVTEAAQHLSIIHGSFAGFMLLSRLLVYYISVMLSQSHIMYIVLTSCLSSCVKCTVCMYHYCDMNSSGAACITIYNSFLFSLR